MPRSYVGFILGGNVNPSTKFSSEFSLQENIYFDKSNGSCPKEHHSHNEFTAFIDGQINKPKFEEELKLFWSEKEFFNHLFLSTKFYSTLLYRQNPVKYFEIVVSFSFGFAYIMLAHSDGTYHL